MSSVDVYNPLGNTPELLLARTYAREIIPDKALVPESVLDIFNRPKFGEILTQYEHHYGGQMEDLPLEVQNELIFRRLQQVVGTLTLNEAWNSRFEQYGLKQLPDNWEDWQNNVPITDRETLREFYGIDGDQRGLVIPKELGGNLPTASGATTSGAIESWYQAEESRETNRLAGRYLDKHILKPLLGDFDKPTNVIQTLFDSGMWSSGKVIGDILNWVKDNFKGPKPGEKYTDIDQLRRANFISAGHMEPSALEHMLKIPGSSFVVGLPREIYKFAENAANADLENRQRLRVAMFGGGFLYPHQEYQFRRTYPNAQIMSWYSSTQALVMGLQLRETDKTHRTVPGLHFIEVVDPETGRWMPPGEEGEICVTRLHSDNGPIRMLIGDRGKWYPPFKEDPNQSYHLELVGRSGDIVQLNESHYDSRKIYESVFVQLEAMGLDIKEKAGDVQFDVIHGLQPELHLKIVVPEVDESTFDQRIREVSSKRDVMINGLKAAMNIYDMDEDHMRTVEETFWKLNIKFVRQEGIFVSNVGKAPLVRTIHQ